MENYIIADANLLEHEEPVMTSAATKPNDAFELLTAIIAGEATIEDGVAKLKGEGIESPEAMLSTLRLGFQQRERQRAEAVRPVDLPLRRQTKTPAEIVARIVQRVPEVPFILKGVTYDPKDITRFNGQELHFVAAPTGGHMLVVEHRELIEDWWHLTYLDRYRQGLVGVRADLSADGGAVQSREFHPRTWFFQDDNLGGSQIYLDANTGYPDLTDVSMGVFSDWNDQISSYWMLGTQVVVLHQDLNWSGTQTFSDVLAFGTSEFKRLSLRPFGWNDRASSIETW
jgi:hypothetical protein